MNSLMQQLWLPNACALCEAQIVGDAAICADCVEELPFNRQCCATCALPLATAVVRCGRCLAKRPLVTQLIAPFRYAHPLDSLVLRFKKRSDLASGALLASLFLQNLPSSQTQPLPQALVPVPLHRSRLRERGFDQSLLLAKSIGQELGIPVQDMLLRQRNTGSQGGLNARERARNMRGAFKAMQESVDAGTGKLIHVALVDDVATTTATLNACALALKRAGVQRVDAWVIARA